MVQEGWASFSLFQAQNALRQENRLLAIQFLQKIETHKRRHPRVLDLLAENSYELGLQTGQIEYFQESLKNAQLLSDGYPYYSRGWYYRAVSAMQLYALSGAEIADEQWESRVAELKQALALEPESAWLCYRVGTALLQNAKNLSKEEQQEAIQYLEKSMSIHYVYETSRYLTASLATLWQTFRDFDLLISLVPKDGFAYEEFMRFLRDQKLWREYHFLYPLNQIVVKRTYDTLCFEGEKLLQEGKRARAAAIFRRAYWLDPTKYRARAGLWVTEPAFIASIPYGDRWLQEMFEQEGENLSFYIPMIRKELSRSQGPYARGLFLQHAGDLSIAMTLFERVHDYDLSPFSRRHIAKMIWDAGDHRQALDLMMPKLGDPVADIRDLLLLEAWIPAKAKEIRQVIDRFAQTSYPAEAWTQLKDGGLGISLHLKPGRSRILVPMRVSHDARKKVGVIQFHLWDTYLGKQVGQSYVKDSSWRTYPMTVDTSGGRRWLEVVAVDGSDAATIVSAIDFGGVQVVFES